MAKGISSWRATGTENRNPPPGRKHTFRSILGTFLGIPGVSGISRIFVELAWKPENVEIAKVARGISSWRPTGTGIPTRHLRVIIVRDRANHIESNAKIDFEEVIELSTTSRGKGGFGSTGV